MKLAEVLNKVYKWSYQYKNKTQVCADFVNNAGDLVTVHGVIDGSIDLLVITFDTNLSQGITGGGDQFAIFATVIDIVKDMVKFYNPDFIGYAADKSEQSRVDLYNRMTARYKPENYTKITSSKQLKPEERKSFESFLRYSNDDYYELTLLARNNLLV